MATQDYHDPIQVLDHVHQLIDNHKADLGLAYVAYQDEELLPQYPAALVSMESPVERRQHATRMFLVTFNLDIWIFHARLTAGKALRSKEDIELAQNVRKLLHANYTLPDEGTPAGHIVFGFVESENSGLTIRSRGQRQQSVVTTRLSWTGQNRVLYQDS